MDKATLDALVSNAEFYVTHDTIIKESLEEQAVAWTTNLDMSTLHIAMNLLENSCVQNVESLNFED